jgi:predicted outer membrane repeat protein
MSFFSWLRNRTSTRSTRRWDGLQIRPTTPRSRLQLEALEDRWMPSTLTVTSIADSGAGTLRADIAAAQSGDTINFATSLDGKTITLTSGELYITKGLTIQGPGAGQLTISGNKHSRVFEVNATQPVVLSGLKIIYGVNDASVGGGIANDRGSTLTVSDSTISGNRAADGGGIANAGTLTISDCFIAGNQAIDGGGIRNLIGGKLTVSDSTIRYNSASYDGGGIYNFTGARGLTISGCELDHNSAYLSGGGIYTKAGTATLTNCTLAYNRVSGSSDPWGGHD